MKTNLKTLLLLFLLSTTALTAKPLTIQSGTIHFDSKTPIEKFGGGGNKVTGTIDLENKEVTVTVDLTIWTTDGKLRTAHMHENYLETDKFPDSVFTGKITAYESQTGKISALGKLNLHGVELKDFNLTGTLLKVKSGYQLKANFIVKLSDFHIPVPRLLTLKVKNEIKVQADIQLEEK